MKREDFHRWFNRDFWKAFKSRTFPIKIPQTQKEKNDLVERIYASISSARYAPSIPEAEIVMNKGHGVARTVPFSAEIAPTTPLAVGRSEASSGSKKNLKLNVSSPSMGVIHLIHTRGHKHSVNSIPFFSLNSTRGITLTFCNLTSRTFTTPCASICSNAGFVKKQTVRRVGSSRSCFIC